MKKIFFLHLLMLSSFLVFSQQDIHLEDIWKTGIYSAKYIDGFNFLKDGKHYTLLDDNSIKQYDLATGKFVKDILTLKELKSNVAFKGEIDDFKLSDDESKVLIVNNIEQIYRHSFSANYYVWDFKSKKITPVFAKGKQMYATFSPDAKYVAFMSDNNLYYTNTETGATSQITFDGKYNEVINGGADWVYEEEFTMSRAFEWSPDSKKIAFMRFDESRVKEFTMQIYDKTQSEYPINSSFKYPKVGEENSVVSVQIYNLKTNKSSKVNVGNEEDIYIPRIKWTQDENTLCITKLNRHQDHLQLLLADANKNTVSVLLEEKNKYYIDIHDNLIFLPDGENYIWMSESDGWNHLYLNNMKTQKSTLLTAGNYDVTAFYGYDPSHQEVYYQSAEISPMERQVYAVNIKTNQKKCILPFKGNNDAQFSTSFDFCVNTFSTANTPPTFVVYDREGREVRKIEENTDLNKLLANAHLSKLDFFDFTTSQGVKLNGWMIKPRDFDANKKYPVFMYLYGGPNSQEVLDQWKGRNFIWFQMLAQKGYIVACVDNRGTGARGEEFRKMTHLQLGKLETIDQIEAAKYLGNLPFADKQRIGIFGWSYGGFMSTLCILKGNDVFKSAIAVAPVTNWKWYDSIYTERYMHTDSENKSGYADNSPVNFADRLKGNYLIVHGIADDNVHFQNTVEMCSSLIEANKQYETYFYPNRNHGIYGGNARLHLYQKMTNFILEKL
ncbi:MAG: S9 family peptidase [Saprospiraceae bacterium]|nr:S9 family peptidase [Saprospiraceae bacterium]